MDRTIDVAQIVEMQTDTVARWHQHPMDNPYSGILQSICNQHQFNYLLWHEEDIARSKDVSDSDIAQVKRAIDRYNQQRNDGIERVDDEIATLLETQGTPNANAPLNTETPGSAIDRLSILALRIYHLKEQVGRTDVDQKHVDSVNHKIAVCLLQQNSLKQSLSELVSDIFAGRKRHQTYRQFKMYNDPTLNPYLYQAKQMAKSSKAA